MYSKAIAPQFLHLTIFAHPSQTLKWQSAAD